MPLRLRSVASSSTFIYALFFMSGGVALGCESAYFRALERLFGASHEATGALLAAFMGGLALGSELGARAADRLKSKIRAYAICEAVVGGYAALAPYLFEHAYAAGAHVGSASRVALAFAILMVPTTAMGATLPLLVAATVRSRGALRAGLGALYTVNLAGGVAGALACGFVLLPALGLRATTWTLAGSAALVAIGALSVAYATKWLPIASSPAAPPTLSNPNPIARTDLLAPWIAAWIGFLSFALQVAYNRVLALLLGAAAYTFALVVAVVLASTAIGGAVGARARRSEDEVARRGLDPFWANVARRCLTLAIVVNLGTLIVYVAPSYVAWAAGHMQSMTWVRVIVVVLVVGAPSYQIGALFPALASRFPSQQVGRAAGRAALATTLGNIGGALVAAFVAIPMRGVEWTLTVAGVLAIPPALVAGWRGGRAPFTGIAIASALACVFSITLRPAWDAVALSAGSYRVHGYRAKKGDDCAGAPFTENRVLFFRDGPVGTVTVLGHAGGAQCSLYSLRVNGKAEGSVFVGAPLGERVPIDGPFLPIGDLPSEILAGWLPAAAGPVPEDALMVGWGTGISARALLDAGARHIVAVELEPAVITGAALFDRALEHDPRIAIVIDDARMVLRRAPSSSFDVVVSHPSNPWVVGASALFSREYFSLVRDRLRDGGRVLTWIQLYEMDALSARSLVATFLESFPDAHAFRISPASRDIFLLGIKSSSPTSRDAIAAAIRARYSDDSARALHLTGLTGIDALMAGDIADADALARYAGGAPVNTDDLASLEYRIADHVLRGTGDDAAAIVRGLTNGN